METKYGTIVSIISKKGYGFIRREDGKDLFFHISGVLGTEFKNLKVGDKVEFLEAEGPKGLYAFDVAVM